MTLMRYLLVVLVFGLPGLILSEDVPNPSDNQGGFMHKLVLFKDPNAKYMDGITSIMSPDREKALQGVELLQSSMRDQSKNLSIENLCSILDGSTHNSVMDTQKEEGGSSDIVSEVKPELRPRFAELNKRLGLLQPRFNFVSKECTEFKKVLETEHKEEAKRVLLDLAVSLIALFVDAKSMVDMSELTPEILNEIDNHLKETEKALQGVESFLNESLVNTPGSKAYKERQKVKLGLGIGIGIGVPVVLGIIALVVYKLRSGTKGDENNFTQMNNVVMSSNYERV